MSIKLSAYAAEFLASNFSLSSLEKTSKAKARFFKMLASKMGKSLFYLKQLPLHSVHYRLEVIHWILR